MMLGKPVVGRPASLARGRAGLARPQQQLLLRRAERRPAAIKAVSEVAKVAPIKVTAKNDADDDLTVRAERERVALRP